MEQWLIDKQKESENLTWKAFKDYFNAQIDTPFMGLRELRSIIAHWYLENKILATNHELMEATKLRLELSFYKEDRK